MKMDSNEVKWAKQASLESLFNLWLFNFAMKGPIPSFFTNLGRNGGWKNPRTSAWSRNFD